MRMTQKQFGLFGYVFQPTWFGTALLLVCVSLFIKLGHWQYTKAMLKMTLQEQYMTATQGEAVALPATLEDATLWRYKKVKVRGVYVPAQQILLDNQVEESQAGFHVLTPLKITGSESYVLVNRGWIAGKARHADLPTFTTPTEEVEVVGQVWLPSKKNFTLDDNAQNSAWNPVWQFVDLDRYRQAVSLTIVPVVIRLDVASSAGGFVRNWQIPADRIVTNLSYAYQWFGFAVASILIYLYLSIRKTRDESMDGIRQ